MSSQTSPPSLREILIFLKSKKFPSRKVEALGRELQIPDNIVEDKLANHGILTDYDNALADLINYWLRNETEQSWKKITDALIICGYTAASQNISEETSLNLVEILKFLRRIKFPSSNLRALGIHLNIPENRIVDIVASRRTNGEYDNALMDVIQHWINDDPQASWKKLKDAVTNSEMMPKTSDGNIGAQNQVGIQQENVQKKGNDPNVQADMGSANEAEQATEDEEELLSNKRPRLMQGENTCRNAGFSVKDTTSVVYSGKKNSLNWEKYGITLLFEDRKVPYEEDSGCPIKVSVVESNEFIYPETFKEAVSTIYHIDCPKPLYATVTIRINHTVAEEDRKNLHLLCSDDKQPPYHFSILNDAQFTSAYGEIKVNKFSFFQLGKLKRLFGYYNDVFEASLYYKDNPICQNRGQHKFFFIYITVVKSTSVLKDSMKEYISRHYGDLIKLGDTELLSYNDINGDINVSTEIWKSNPHHEVTLEPSQPFSLNQSIITDYESGCPPHRRFTIKANIERGWKVNINLQCTNRQCTLSFDSDIVMDDAEVSRIHQEDSRNCVHEIYIKDGEVGHSYSSIFQRCMDDNVHWVELQDPYLRNDYQINNLVRFCEVMMNGCGKLKELKIITSPCNSTYGDYEEAMSQLTKSLQRYNVTMSVEHLDTLHDREVRFSTGWIVNLGRGLDYFKRFDKRFSIGFYDYNFRPCRKTKVIMYWKKSETSDSPTQ